MSNVRARFLNSYVTVWKQQERVDDGDPYSDGGWSVPIAYKCNYRTGGSVSRDQAGAEFNPQSTYRMQTSSTIPISIGDRVTLGESASPAPESSAETVRQIQTKTTLVGLQDFNVLTG